ncbi:MAG TPA: 5'/3'-nucleotidase SurE [Gammaproteobacteria bacterium]|nr:5'/3'-nucleotidase SurE [Gammaproteobacteria bacterium]
MDILVSNDDGYLAPGISILAEQLREVTPNVTIVAPERNRSASSSSLTLDSPLRLTQVAERVYYVDGTPTDCVHLAITGLLASEPDMVVSGINNGANLGDDVIYSGTVAAAIEGRFLGLPAIAVSLTSFEGKHYDTAAQVACGIIRQLQTHPLPSDTILNINVPDIPLAEIEGLRTTRLGSRHKAEPVVRGTDPRGRALYWIGPPGEEQDAGPGTDFHAISLNCVSITPLHVDLTQYKVFDTVNEWVKGITL